MMSQSDFHKNAGRWGGSDVAARHYRAAVLSNAFYAPQGNGASDGTFFQTAILSGTVVGTGADVKLTATSDDDALVYLNGKYVGGNPGVHGAVANTLDLGDLNGANSLEIF